MTITNSRNSIFLFFILLLYYSANSQQNNFRSYTIEDGLPQSTIFEIKQDNRGYLWIGTNGGGVCRFDGLNFTTFSKKDGLAGNIVRCIEEDSKGKLWIGTEKGLNLFDGFQFKQITKEDGFSGEYILSIYEAGNGSVWVGTSGGGLNKIDMLNDSITITTFTKKDGLISNYIFDIIEDKNNRIWLAMLGGINIISTNNGNIKVDKLLQNIDIPSNFILCAEKDKYDNLWFGTSENGAFKINMSGADSGFVQIINFKTNVERVYDILPDNNQNIWFATDKNGIVKLNLKSNIISIYNTDNGLPDNQILSLYQDSENNIWIGSNGSGLVKYLGDYFAHYSLNEGLPNQQVFDIDQDVFGNYYLATYGGGLVKFTNSEVPDFIVFNQNSGLTDNRISSISTAKDGKIWIATASKGIFSFDGKKFKNYTTRDGLIDNSVYCIYVDSEQDVWCGTQGGISMFDGENFINFTEYDGLINNEVQTIIEDLEGKIWIGTLGGLAWTNKKIMTDFDETDGLAERRIQSLACDNKNNIWIGTFGSGLYLYENNTSNKLPISFVADADLISSNNIYSLQFLNDSVLIVGTDKGFDKIELDVNKQIRKVKNYSKLEGFKGIENNLNAIYKDKNNNIWFGTVKGLTRYDPGKEPLNLTPPKTHIVELNLFFENIDWGLKSDSLKPWFRIPTDLKLPYSNNHLTFKFSAISLKNPEKVRYKYMLRGLDNKWSPPRIQNQASYPGLRPGEYTFMVKAGNENEIWNSEPIEFNFSIEPPFWKRWWFYLISIIFLVIIILIYIRYRERRLIQQKIILENKVQERTIEIRKQNKQIEKQKKELEIKNKNITDSIKYAKRIQRAVLPQENILNDSGFENFILFKPKDIVSGDFYWMSKKNNELIVTAADCTGHGVPGAFMSMLGVSFLNKIVNELGITQPNMILNLLRENVINSLQQKGLSGESKDGMDISLCVIDLEKNRIQYSGANNPLYIIRNNELIELKPDKMPISFYENISDFKSQEIELKKSDTIYLFSDGFNDQFGGPYGRKFMKKQFKEMLLNNQDKSMYEQQKHFETVIEEWKNLNPDVTRRNEQIDDILVIGLRV